MSRFGVLNPAGALAFAAVVALIALHLWDRRRRQRFTPVSTLLLWKRIPATDLARRWMRQDLLFLLQLGVLLALVSGSLRPYRHDRAGGIERAPHIIVLDVSASMQAGERDGTRFELARRRARALIGSLASTSEAMLIVAAGRPRVVMGWTTDHGRLLGALELLRPLDTPGQLASALRLALGETLERPAARVAVFTDLPPEGSGVSAAEQRRVHHVQVGRTDDNVAIAGLSVDPVVFQPVEAVSVTALVRNYGRQVRHVRVEASVEQEAWEAREVVLPPRGAESVVLTRPPRSGTLSVRIAAADALAVDDQAVAWIAPTEPLDLLLVTDSSPLAGAFASIAGSMTGGQMEVMSPERYLRERPARRRVTLFDKLVPGGPTPMNALYVAPPLGNTLCPSRGAVERAAVVDWDGSHPVVRGLEGLQALEIERGAELSTPTWATPVVLATAERATFPLLVAGERDGRRIACLGATLGMLASSDHLPLLVLTLGTLRWLGEPPAAAPLAVRTGEPALAGAGPAAAMGSDGGTGLRVAGDPPVVLAERAGAHRLGRGSDARLVLANLFDDVESDIGRGGGGEWPPEMVESGDGSQGSRREFGAWLYVAASMLLAIEWLVWLHLRRTGA